MKDFKERSHRIWSAFSKDHFGFNVKNTLPTRAKPGDSDTSWHLYGSNEKLRKLREVYHFAGRVVTAAESGRGKFHVGIEKSLDYLGALFSHLRKLHHTWPCRVPLSYHNDTKLIMWKVLRVEFSSVQFSSFQSLSRVWLFVTPWIAAHLASLSITNSQSSLRLMSIESVMPSSHLILCHPLLLLPPIPLRIRVFCNESTLHMRVAWSLSFSIIPSKEIPGLISFRMDWLELLAIQGTLKSLLQHHSSKASILRRSAFFTVQLSHPYMTTGKTIALTRWTLVGKVMSLLLNMLSTLVITFFQGVSVF